MSVQETLIIKTEMDTTESVGSVKSLKAQLKELTVQLGSIEDKSSEAFKAAAQRAGELRDEIRGVNDAIENSDPEKKFAPFTRTIQGLAGGFAAAQGAMGLFGAESKDLEKTLLKVQSAMALSQGLNSILEFKNDFKDLGKIIINNVVTAFSTLKGAMIATGIGAFTVAVGLLAAKFMEVSEKNELARKAEENYKKETELAKKAVDEKVDSLNLEILAIKEKTNLAGATLINAKAEKEALKEQIKLAEEHNKLQKEAYTTAEVGGKQITISNMIETDSLKKKLAEKTKEIDNLQLIADKTDELTKKQKESADKKAQLDAIEKARVDKINQDAREAQELSNRTQDDIAKKIDEERAKQNKADEDEIKRKKELSAQKIQVEQERKTSEIQDLKDISESTNESYNDRLAALTALHDKQIITDTEYSEATIKLAQAETETRLKTFQAVSDGLNALGSLVGESTEAGKALAIAQALINTYSAISGQLAAFSTVPIPGYAIAQAIATGVMGIAQVKKIMEVQVPKSSGNGGNGGISAPSSAPAPILPNSRTTTLAPESIGLNQRSNGNQPAQRVYVLESDISNAQNNVKTIVDRSTIK